MHAFGLVIVVVDPSMDSNRLRLSVNVPTNSAYVQPGSGEPRAVEEAVGFWFPPQQIF